jgi:hypothetical protein
VRIAWESPIDTSQMSQDDIISLKEKTEQIMLARLKKA